MIVFKIHIAESESRPGFAEVLMEGSGEGRTTAEEVRVAEKFKALLHAAVEAHMIEGDGRGFKMRMIEEDLKPKPGVSEK